MLLNQFMSACAIMQESATPDGEGGRTVTRTAGRRIVCAITLTIAQAGRVADQAAPVSTYKITTNRADALPFGTVIKRLSDGVMFRTTAAPQVSPEFSGIDLATSPGEVFEA